MDDILPPLSEEDRMLAGLCYPFWPIVPPLVLFGPRREEPFVHFHALQGLALGVASAVGTVLLTFAVWMVFQVLPGSAPAVAGILGVSVFLVGVFAVLFYLSFLFYTAWRASAGRFLRLPLLGAWAENRMRNSLELTEDSYRTDPLPVRAAQRDTGIEVEESLDPNEFLRRHRPFSGPDLSRTWESEEEVVTEPEGVEESGPEPGFRPDSLVTDRAGDEDEAPRRPRSGAPRGSGEPRKPLLPGQTRSPQRPPAPGQARKAPEEGDAGAGDFQPGLLPPTRRPSDRKFRWTPLEDEEEGSDDKPASDGSGFQSW